MPFNRFCIHCILFGFNNNDKNVFCNINMAHTYMYINAQENKGHLNVYVYIHICMCHVDIAEYIFIIIVKAEKM